MRRLLASCAVAAVLAAGAVTSASAESRALLIGVGAYQSTDVPALPGIDKDVRLMADLATRMGVAAPVVLMDKAATRAAILAAMRKALTENVRPDDLVLIYYSGHGTQVEDEDNEEGDGADEVILGHDTGFVTTASGEKGLRGVVTDDEIAGMLKQSPSRNVILLVDACNSGTINKASPLPGGFQGAANGTPKFFQWSGLRSLKSKTFDPTNKDLGAPMGSYVSMSAASDDQSAIATNTGSVFTVGISRAVAAKSATGTITPQEMIQGAREFISQQQQSQTPEIHGSTDLIQKPLPLTGVTEGNGPNWKRVTDLTARMKPLALTGVKPRYGDGDKLVFELNVPAEGFLNIVDVGPDDNITLLFPNKFQPNNKVAAGRFTVPTDAMPFDLPAGAPYGKSKIVAFVTSEPLSLLTSASDGKTATLAAPSLAGLDAMLGVATRSFAVQARTKTGGSAWAGVAETEVCGQGGKCR